MNRRKNPKTKQPPFGHPSRPLPFGLRPVPIDEAARLFVEINEGYEEERVREALREMATRRDRGETCFCGNPIWVMCFELTMCFACVTGTATAKDDIDVVLS